MRLLGDAGGGGRATGDGRTALLIPVPKQIDTGSSFRIVTLLRVALGLLLIANLGRIPAFSTGDRTAPILDVIIPLHAKSQSPLLGVAQFIIDGQSIRDRFAAMDQDLLWNALGIFFGGSVIILAILNWAFQRLQRTNLLLAERTTHLQRANQELVLAKVETVRPELPAHLKIDIRPDREDDHHR